MTDTPESRAAALERHWAATSRELRQAIREHVLGTGEATDRLKADTVDALVDTLELPDADSKNRQRLTVRSQHPRLDEDRRHRPFTRQELRELLASVELGETLVDEGCAHRRRPHHSLLVRRCDASTERSPRRHTTEKCRQKRAGAGLPGYS